MTSNPQETALDATGLEDGLPDGAPEADVVEQHRSPQGWDERDLGSSELPIEADPADVHEQRRAVDGSDDDDYR